MTVEAQQFMEKSTFRQRLSLSVDCDIGIHRNDAAD